MAVLLLRDTWEINYLCHLGGTSAALHVGALEPRLGGPLSLGSLPRAPTRVSSYLCRKERKKGFFYFPLKRVKATELTETYFKAREGFLWGFFTIRSEATVEPQLLMHLFCSTPVCGLRWLNPRPPSGASAGVRSTAGWRHRGARVADSYTRLRWFSSMWERKRGSQPRPSRNRPLSHRLRTWRVLWRALRGDASIDISILQTRVPRPWKVSDSVRDTKLRSGGVPAGMSAWGFQVPSPPGPHGAAFPAAVGAVAWKDDAVWRLQKAVTRSPAVGNSP